MSKKLRLLLSSLQSAVIVGDLDKSWQPIIDSAEEELRDLEIRPTLLPADLPSAPIDTSRGPSDYPFSKGPSA